MRRRIEAWVDAGEAIDQRQPAMHARVRAGHAGQRERDIADAAHVLTGKILVEHPFGDFDLASASSAQLQIGEREALAQRYVLGELVFADVLVEICLLHAPDGRGQAFAGGQPLAQLVP